MFKDRSIILFACAVLATIYAVHLLLLISGSAPSSKPGTLNEFIMTPHLLAIGLGAIFSWLGFFLKDSLCALFSATLYCIGALLFIVDVSFSLPLVVLAFVGCACQSSLNKKITTD